MSAATEAPSSSHTSAPALAIQQTRAAISKLYSDEQEGTKVDELSNLRKRLSTYAKNPRYTKILKKLQKE